MDQQEEYGTFRDLGKGTKAPDGYKKIKVHIVFDVKHDGWYKACLVADGHLTDVPVEYVCSGAEFGELEGHTLIIHKALYGLRSSGLRWWERLAACLKDMGFTPCKGLNRTI
eukprot:9139652-Ditylum_brightwellii.AAC.1